MTAILERRESTSLWARFCEWITSTENRLYIGWFGVIMIPTLLTATSVFIIAFIAAPPVDIDGIREPVSGSLLYGNNIITGAVIPTSNAIGLHFYPIWEAASLDEWLYNGGPYQMIVLHFLLGVCCYMGREWELSFRLGMRPWIAVAYSAPVAAATAVFLIYPIGQGSFSDGYMASPSLLFVTQAFCIKIMHSVEFNKILVYKLLFYYINLNWSNPFDEFYLKGGTPCMFIFFVFVIHKHSIFNNIFHTGFQQSTKRKIQTFLYQKLNSDTGSLGDNLGDNLGNNLADKKEKESSFLVPPPLNEDPDPRKKIKDTIKQKKNNNKDNPLLSDKKLILKKNCSTDEEKADILNLKNKTRIQFPSSSNSSIEDEKKVENSDEKNSNQWARSLKNLPAVYGIICKENNKIYVGETENYKKRFLYHVKMLKDGNHPNKSLQHDFNELERDESLFEFILFEVEDGNTETVNNHEKKNQVLSTNLTTLDSSKRKALEAQIQKELIKKDQCYNTGLAETIQPRTQGLHPSGAGVLFVKCKKTGKMGFFYSGFTYGIAGKIRQLKGKLKQGTYSNGKHPLELDWQKFGEDGFEWGGYVWGPNYVDEKTCKKIVNHLIYSNLSQKKEVYNTFYHDINSTEPNPNRLPLTTSLAELELPETPPIDPMTFIPGDFTVFTPTPDEVAQGKKPITLINQKSIFTEGCVYLSINEAATAIGLNWNVINSRLKNNQYRLATKDEIQQELQRRNWSTNSALAIDAKVSANQKTTKGVIQYFKINNQVFKGFKAVQDAGFGSRKSVIKKLDDSNNTNFVRISQEEYNEFLMNVEKVDPG